MQSELTVEALQKRPCRLGGGGPTFSEAQPSPPSLTPSSIRFLAFPASAHDLPPGHSDRGRRQHLKDWCPPVPPDGCGVHRGRSPLETSCLRSTEISLPWPPPQTFPSQGPGGHLLGPVLPAPSPLETLLGLALASCSGREQLLRAHRAPQPPGLSTRPAGLGSASWHLGTGQPALFSASRVSRLG